MYFFGTAWEPPDLRDHGLDLAADVAALHAELRPAPLPRDLMGPRARLVMDSAREIGMDWQPLPKFVDQAVLRRDGLGAYGAARWNARRFVDDAVAAGARLVTGATVTRVQTRAGVATGVEMRIGGRRAAVRTGRVVLAAGGLGTPMILRASGIDRAGRDFFYDPVLVVIGHGRRRRRGVRAADARRRGPARRGLPAHRPVPPAVAAQRRDRARRTSGPAAVLPLHRVGDGEGA